MTQVVDVASSFDGRTVMLPAKPSTVATAGYALTIHRAQGTLYDRAHVIAKFGGRELAYVAMSRARDQAIVYSVSHPR